MLRSNLYENKDITQVSKKNKRKRKKKEKERKKERNREKRIKQITREKTPLMSHGGLFFF